MATFDTKRLPAGPDVTAPDGSNVRILLSRPGGSMAHFELAPGLVSIPVAHKTVEEVWYFLSGRGEMWRREGEYEEIAAVEPGVCISIPVGTAFQFRSDGEEPLTAVAITMPPWPGGDEAYVVEGRWQSKLGGSMTESIDLRDYIRDVPDFPQEGILFRDITPLLQKPEAFEAALQDLTEYVADRSPDAIVGIESRGFLFGTPIADRLGLPFIPIRKPGKLPAARMSVEYALEYGSGQLDIHSDALSRGQSVVVVDDLLATGGTAVGACKLVELIEGKVAGIAFLIELEALGGRRRLDGYDVFSVLRYA